MKVVVVIVVLVFYLWFKLHKVSSVFILMLHTRSSQENSQLSTCEYSNAISIDFLMCPPCVWHHMESEMLSTTIFWCALCMCCNIWKRWCYLWGVIWTFLNSILKFSLQSQDLQNFDVYFHATSFWCIDIALSWIQYIILM